MGFFDKISKSINAVRKEIPEDTRQKPEVTLNAIPYGENKQDGDHDHRRNKGGDRTPAQKKLIRIERKLIDWLLKLSGAFTQDFSNSRDVKRS